MTPLAAYWQARRARFDHINACKQCERAQAPIGDPTTAPFADWCGVLPCAEGARLDEDYRVAEAASALNDKFVTWDTMAGGR